MSLEIGQAVTHEDYANYRCGYVAEFKPGGRVWVVFPEEQSVTQVPAGIAETWAKNARNRPSIGLKVARYYAQAKAATLKRHKQQNEERAKRQTEQAAYSAEFKARCPQGFKGYVIAEYDENESDLMTDYFGHKTTRSMILCFTRSNRSLFGTMRKAAATFEPTRHLAENVEANEHRENYSMGGGMYLKAGSGQHSTGWAIRIGSTEFSGNAAEFGPACQGTK